jgi:hypothetical protein
MKAPMGHGQVEVVSSRNVTLATTKGHVVRFYKGIAKAIPKVILEDAMAIGVLPTDDKYTQNESLDSILGDVAKGSERVRQIREVIEALVERNQRGDFAASGLPSLVVVSDALGYKVEQAEVSRVWAAIRAEKANAKALGEDIHEAPQRPEDADELAEALKASIDSVVETGSEFDYTAAGVPTVRSLENRLGYDISEDERDTAWAAHKAAKKGSAKTSRAKAKAE